VSVRSQETTAVLIVLIASAGTALAVLGSTAFDEPPAAVELLARAPERGNWSPEVIEVTKDEEVTLVIRNVDVVTHGFYLPGLELSVGAIKAGDVHELRFTPKTAGEFPFYCSVWCSEHHMQMRGKLIVK
jgi:heme/copper-type cytochrome/quinol oxidase subunit 2